MSACSVLIGDGGHNVREVLFGLVCSVTILHTFIKDLTIELQQEYKNKLDIKQNIENINNDSNITKYKWKLLNYVIKYILNIFKDLEFTQDVYIIAKDIFLFLMGACASWQPFIYTFYTYTKNINIVGVYKTDLDTFNPEITKYPIDMFQTFKDKMYNTLFNEKHSVESMFNQQLHINTQIFFALDNNRYLMNPNDSFKFSADTFIEKLLLTYPVGAGQDVLEKVNIKLEEQLIECELDSKNVRDVPFAFSTKKSRKKKTHY
jgi:hypothetical protein